MDKGSSPFIHNLKTFAESTRQMFFCFTFKNNYQPLKIFYSLLTTMSLAALTTLIGTAAGLFFGIATAENLSFKFIVKTVRAVMSFIRSVPTIIWVLVFSVTADIGAGAAVIGMSFHSIAYLVKGFSESFEQIEKDSIDALKSCGASPAEIFMQAVLPASISNIVSWSFFRFEINFANAVALGAAAGAGGIGYELFMAGSMHFNMKEVGMLSYLIFISAASLEFISIKIRKNLRSSA